MYLKGNQTKTAAHKMPPKRSKKEAANPSSSEGISSGGKNNDNFGYCQESYWDNRYKDESGYLEWYFSFEQLEDLIETYVVQSVESNGNIELSVLESGCGDTPILFGFFDAYSKEHKIARCDGIDYAESVIQLLNTSEKKKDKRISFSKMDARHMDYGDEEFNIIFDKGTIDAMLCSPSGFEDVKDLFHEYCRVLMNGGKVVVISHMRPDSENFHDFLENCVYPAFEDRTTRHWSIDAHVIADESKPIEKSSKKRKSAIEDEENEDNDGGPTVYIFSPVHRRTTRVSATYDAFIDFQLHEH